MANVIAARGFKPMMPVGGNGAWNGGITEYDIASGYATNVFAGDVVKLVTAGVLNKAAAGEQMRGVLVGVKWTGTDGVPRVSQYWPASTATLNSVPAKAMVIDDPNVVFMAQFVNSSSIPVIADRGATFNLYDTTGSTASGLSGEGVDYSTLNTTALQFRFLRFVERPDNDTLAANSFGLFMPALHDFRVNTGI